MIRVCLAIILTLTCWFGRLPTASALDTGRYGQVTVTAPTGVARGIIFLFADHSGLKEQAKHTAEALAHEGLLVATIDTDAYIARLDQSNEKCHYVDYDADLFSRTLQREYHFPNYVTPILAGVGQGATLAELVLAQASATTIAGVIALNPAATLLSRTPICAAAITSEPNGFRYGPARKLAGFLAIGLTLSATKGDREEVAAQRHTIASVEVREFGSAQTVGKILSLMTEPHLPILAEVAAVSQLPLNELPVEHSPGIVAIMLSGDGGWRDLDKTVGENLRGDGIPVVGWDSLRYFWNKKTPDQTARALSAVMRTYMRRWHADQVVLIGYSFGADVMPFLYNRLPAVLRSHVVLITLLALSKFADFQIRVSDWLGVPPGPDALTTLPEAAKISPHLMQCIYGAKETDSACIDLASRGIAVIRTAGGHHFDHAYDLLSSDILEGLKRRIGTLPGPMVPPGQKANQGPTRRAFELKPILIAVLASLFILLSLLGWLFRSPKATGNRAL